MTIEFLDAIESNWPSGEGWSVSPGAASCCDDCCSLYGVDSAAEFEAAQERGDIVEEPSFSWSSCEACGSHLGGNRNEAHAVRGSGDSCEIVHLSICDDCMLFFANGDIPERWEA